MPLLGITITMGGFSVYIFFKSILYWRKLWDIRMGDIVVLTKTNGIGIP